MSLENTVEPDFTWIKNLPHRPAGEPVLRAKEIAQLLEPDPAKQKLPTAEQTAIIEAKPGAMLVVAGAGSGKTETMATRVIWLLANGIFTPNQVLGLTFTKKAASELQERFLERLSALTVALQKSGRWVPPGLATGSDELLGESPIAATYNGFALDFVKEHALRIGKDSKFKVLSTAGSWQIAFEIAQNWPGKKPFTQSPAYIANGIISLSGALAEHMRTAAELTDYLTGMKLRLESLPISNTSTRKKKLNKDSLGILKNIDARLALVPMVEEFNRRKQELEAIDFSDQLSLAAQIARDSTAAVQAVRDQYKVVMLDEFQDTSVVQLDFLRNLFGLRDDEPEELRVCCAVGDPKQAIFTWRGASAASLELFAQTFGTDTQIVERKQLATSWRNDKAILKVANVIGAELSQDDLVLQPSFIANEGEVQFAGYVSQTEEFRAVAEWIKSERENFRAAQVAAGKSEVETPSAAILLRKRSHMQKFGDALAELGIEYQIVSGGGLLHEPEVADVWAVLELLADSGRGDALFRLLDGPRFKLGVSDLGVLGEWRGRLRRLSEVDWKANPDAPDVSLLEVTENLPPRDYQDHLGRSLTETGRQRLMALREVLRQIREQSQLELPDLISWIIRCLGVDLAVLADQNRDPKLALANLEELRRHAQSFVRDNPGATLKGFLRFLEVSVEKENALEAESTMPAISNEVVAISTVHASKGLEWDIVAVSNLSDSIFPSFRSVKNSKKLDDDGFQIVNKSGWFSSIADAELPYALRGDQGGFEELDWDSPWVDDHDQLLKAFADFRASNGLRSLLEERRLMYVAVTRAKRKMLLSGSRWGDGTYPKPFSRFLYEVAAIDPDGALAEIKRVNENTPLEYNPVDDDAKPVVWPTPPGEREEKIQALQKAFEQSGIDAPVEVTDGVLELQAAADHLIAHLNSKAELEQTELPLRVSPSAIVEMALDEAKDKGKSDADGALAKIEPEVLGSARPMPRRPSKYAQMGTRFHAWVEESFIYGTALDVKEQELFPHDEGAQNAQILERLQEQFKGSVFGGTTPLKVEVPIALVLENAYIPGIIDAVYSAAAFKNSDLIADPDPYGIVIVDWKTGAVPSGKELEAKAIQLSIYRLAWAQQYGVPLEKIHTLFYYVAENKIRKITDHIGEAELVEMLNER